MHPMSGHSISGSGNGIGSPASANATSYPRAMQSLEVVTPYPDLDELLGELLGHWQRILGSRLAGAYVQGSFALGGGDQHSDCDWLVATHGSLTKPEISQLRNLHDEIPTREGHWCHDLEGPYAPIAEFASLDQLGHRWLYNNHGHRTLEWDDHCNRYYTRWILRDHGITLTGPISRSFMPVVPSQRRSRVLCPRYHSCGTVRRQGSARLTSRSSPGRNWPPAIVAEPDRPIGGLTLPGGSVA